MKKILFVPLFLVLLLGIFATAEEAGISTSPKITEVVSGVGENVGTEVSGFVEDFVAKRGIQPSDIDKIESVDFDALPKEVNIENVGDHNLAVYEVDYNAEQGQEKIYVVAYSVEQLKSQGDIIVAQDKRNFLNFGHGGEMTSGFLETATGVETSLEKGYVMPRDGSITAVSTNLEVVGSTEGNIEIVVYKNGEQISFGNTIDTATSGVKKDYDVQSKNVVAFEAGDVISVYAKGDSDVAWKDVVTIVEITTSN